MTTILTDETGRLSLHRPDHAGARRHQAFAREFVAPSAIRLQFQIETVVICQAFTPRLVIAGGDMRRCWLTVLGCGGVAFLALASGAKNLETYLYLPGAVWIVGGTFVVGCWAYEKYCVAEGR